MYGDMINPSEVSYNIDAAMKYGEMPDDALIMKFEETDIGLADGENQYNEYSRELMKDRSPDAPSLAQDEPRRSYSAKGIINQRYAGGRGEDNYPAHPEMFLEMTDHEPRHGMVDPDFNKFREQERFRAKRYTYLHSDADNSVHEGVWSEAGAFNRSRYAVQKAIQPRARIFATSKDGRREGLRRDYYPHKSLVNKVEETMARFRPGDPQFIDFITDFALNPQRRTQKISNEIVRNSRMYMQNTTDHEFRVAKYGMDNRRQKLRTQMKSDVERAQHDDLRAFTFSGDKVSREEITAAKKSVGILMGAIVHQAHSAKIQHDSGVSHATQSRKCAARASDLNIVLSQIQRDSAHTFANNESNGQSRKNAPLSKDEHRARQQTTSHIDSSHALHQAEKMFKMAGGDKNNRKIHSASDRDGADVENSENMSVSRQSNKNKIKGGSSNRGTIKVEGKSLLAPTFKRGKNGAPINNGVNAANNFGQSRDLEDKSKNSLAYKTLSSNYKITGTNDTIVEDAQFSDNTKKERLGGNMNTDKYRVKRYTQMDGGMNDISMLS